MVSADTEKMQSTGAAAGMSGGDAAKMQADMQPQDGNGQAFKMIDPTELKKLLSKGLGPKVNSVL